MVMAVEVGGSEDRQQGAAAWAREAEETPCRPRLRWVGWEMAVEAWCHW